MNITSVEVSTPFFHENNTAAMNSYETHVKPLSTAEPLENAVTASPMSLMKTSNRFANRFTNRFTRASPKETVGLMTGPESEASAASENTLIYMMQTSLYHSAYRKQYSKECECGYSCAFRLGSPPCMAILDTVEKEYQKMAKGKELFMQHVRTMTPSETAALVGEGGVGGRSAPTPWRWENRTAVPVEERGACLFYHPMRLYTFDERASDQTPICFLHENDVIDNGTVMCLQARENECFYGNETIKAILEFDTSKRTQSKYKNMCDDALKWSFLFATITILFSFVVVVAHIINHLMDSYKKGYTVRSAFRVAFYTVSTVALWEVFLDYGLFPALPFVDKGLTYALCMPRGGA